MTTNTKTNTYEAIGTKTGIKEESSKTALGIGIVLAAIVGLWGLACLIGGIASSGIGGVIVGYIKAVTG